MSKVALKPPEADSLYETDFYAWTQKQAELLRARRFEELDLANLIDEVASVGGSDKQQIESRLDILLGHLLKWMYQPGQRNSHWIGTIVEQRRRIARVLKASPSLKRYPAKVFDECYQAARLLASKETGIALAAFPEDAPFSLDQTLDMDFLPKEPDLLDQS